MTAIWALTSCSADQTVGDGVPVDGYTVSFSLRNAALTRTTNTGYDREKAVSNIYAVAFSAADGSYFDTFALAESSGTYSFDMGQAGAYYIYVVANTTIDGFATKDYADEATFLADIESADPGTDLAASTNFLMLSKRTLADVDGDAVTDLGAIQMERAAARIDIDASAISGIEITKVVVKNRYTTTKLARLGTDVDMTTVTKEATPKEYVRGNGAGQVDAISDGSALVDDDQWQGIIYTYENPVNSTDADEITVVEITHTLGGVESVTSVPFYNMPLKRNYLYTVTLTNASPTVVQDIHANITVVDWDESTTLKFSTLSDSATPSFTVTSAHSTNQADNPTLVRAKRTQDNTIQLTVTSGGAMGSDLTYEGGQVGADNDYTLADYTAANSAASPIALTSTSYDADGHIVQTYTISVPQTLALAMSSSDYLRFHVSNQFDDTHYQSFDVKSGYAMTATLSTTSYVYDGSARQPALATLTVTDDNNVEQNILSQTSTYDIAYSDNTNAGTGHVTVTTNNTSAYEGATCTVDFTINKAQPTLTLSPTSLSVKYDGSASATKSITATLSHGECDGQAPTTTWDAGTYATIGAPTSFSNTHVSTISVTGVAEQKTAQTLTVTAPETDNYLSASATCQIKVVNGVDATALNLGDIIYDDGDVTANNAYNSSKHAIGVVVYKAASADAACEAGKTCRNGSGTVVGRVLVMSLQDVSGTQAWFTANNTDHDNTLFPNCSNNTSTASSDYRGYEKTKQMATQTGECSGHTHAAATAAWNYTPSNATSTDYLEGSTGWFLPSIGQWFKVANAMGVSSIPNAGSWSGAGSVATTLSTYITNAGGNASTLVGSSRYWSSSEYDDTDAQSVYWNAASSLGFYWGYSGKSSTYYVRPFLAY